jgi:hypothetical protein
MGGCEGLVVGIVLVLPDPHLPQQKVPSSAGLCFFYQLGVVLLLVVFRLVPPVGRPGAAVTQKESTPSNGGQLHLGGGLLA